MLKPMPLFSRSSRRVTTLTAPSSLRTEVCPPSLRCAPGAEDAPGTTWQRWMFWLMAPAPHDAAPSAGRLPAVRTDFVATLTDIDTPMADALRKRIGETRSLRELWHLRAEIYRVVGIAHSQRQAEDRLSLLNRHFPTRAPRSQFASQMAAL